MLQYIIYGSKKNVEKAVLRNYRLDLNYKSLKYTKSSQLYIKVYIAHIHAINRETSCVCDMLNTRC